jgi:hypothetical protein
LTYVRVRAPKRDLQGYTGTYVSDELPARWKVQVVDDRLTVNRQKGAAVRLNPAFEDGFLGSALGIIALFIRESKGRYRGDGRQRTRLGSAHPLRAAALGSGVRLTRLGLRAHRRARGARRPSLHYFLLIL